MRRRAALVALCGTQITSWGVLYYAFRVALAEHRGHGWSGTGATAAFCAGLVAPTFCAGLVAAAAGVPVGRWLNATAPVGC